MKRSHFSRKPLETESLAEVQFPIDSCCLVSQSNYLNNSNKDCDWLIFIREQMHADSTIPSLENNVCLKVLAECVGKLMGLRHKTNREASTELCLL